MCPTTRLYDRRKMRPEDSLTFRVRYWSTFTKIPLTSARRKHWSTYRQSSARVANWSLTSLQQRLVKAGGRLIKHARYYGLLLAESHLTRRLFGNMLRRIAMVASPAG